jgi:hypothetical protein
VANACGDGDAFGDPGERVRIALFLQNISGFNLTGINLSLSTADPDIECILDSTIQIPSFPNGTTLNTQTLSPGDDPANPSDGRFFEVVISPNAETLNAADAARANMTMTLTSNEAGGTVTPVGITTLLDLDIPPGASPTYTAARCDADLSTAGTIGALCASDAACGGAVGSCKPGLLFEGFEVNGPAGSTTGGQPQPNDFTTTIGFIEHTAGSDSDTTVVGKACFGAIQLGFVEGVDGFCRIDPDFDTDWHFEVAGTASTSGKAYHGAKSAHWGRHTLAGDRAGDTTPLRQIEAFDTNPINLNITPAATDLFLSFWHIVSFADDNRINFQVGQAGDYADVQISVDQDPSPTIDTFGRWQKLVPFQNVYEHTPQVWSWFGYCHFTPADAAAASNPAIFGETMCFPEGVWSHSGNVLGTNTLSIFNAQSGGALGSAGDGIWVQSKFNLGLYIGQRVKIRWIGQSWAGFGDNWDSYMEPPAGSNPFDIATADDGWWVDDIQLTGAITAPVNPIVETASIPLVNQCPTTSDARCNQSVLSTCPTNTTFSNGFCVSFTVDDTDQNGVISQGEEILLDASQTSNPGGCADGVPQFRFAKNGGTIQDWSTAASMKLSNELPGDNFTVEVRCSSDNTCLTSPQGPPTGVGACVPAAGIRFPEGNTNPATVNAPYAPGFSSWFFGASCTGIGAPGSLLCTQFHNWTHGPSPIVPGEVVFGKLPASYGNMVITTGGVSALPRCTAGTVAVGTVCTSDSTCGTGGVCGKAGILVSSPWGPIPAGSAVCNVPGAAVDTCDISPGGAPLVCPAGPAFPDITCGDSAAPAANTVSYYLAGYNSVALAGGGCAAPGGLPATSAVFSGGGGPGNPADCYRTDEDAVQFGNYAPVIPAGVGCP